MDKTLSERLQERLEEAKKKDFSVKVREIKARLSSEWRTRKTGIFNRKVQHTYEDSPLIIKLTDYRGIFNNDDIWNITISFNDGIKYEEAFGGGIHSYIPGEWEQEFEKVYSRAKEVANKKITELNEAYEQGLKRRFGL